MSKDFHRYIGTSFSLSVTGSICSITWRVKLLTWQRRLSSSKFLNGQAYFETFAIRIIFPIVIKPPIVSELLNFGYCRRLLGECLDSCSIEELQQIENELEQSLSNIRIQKVYLSLKIQCLQTSICNVNRMLTN